MLGVIMLNVVMLQIVDYFRKVLYHWPPKGASLSTDEMENETCVNLLKLFTDVI